MIQYENFNNKYNNKYTGSHKGQHRECGYSNVYFTTYVFVKKKLEVFILISHLSKA